MSMSTATESRSMPGPKRPPGPRWPPGPGGPPGPPDPPGVPSTFEPLTPERRRAMTRQHLLDAAAIVFARHGFHGATLDEIASTAGFTKGAVYSNFKNKEDLLLELLDERVARQLAVVFEVIESGPH